MEPRCVIYRVDNIGDFICTIPALYAIRSLLPKQYIHLIVAENTYSIASSLPCIDTVTLFNANNPFPYASVEYCFLLNPLSVALCRRIAQHDITHKIGYWQELPLWKQLLHTLVRQYYNIFADNTETARMLRFARAINPKAFDALPSFLPIHPIPYSEEELRAVKIFLAPYSTYIVLCIAPFKEGASKTVPDDIYPHIINSILEQFPTIAVIISSAPHDAERGKKLFENITDKKRCALWINSSDITQLVALIDACDIFIGSSSGPTHIAGLLQKHTIAFYPSDTGHTPKRWGTMGNNTTYILSKKNVDTLSTQHPEYFNTFHVQQVLTALQHSIKMLSKTSQEY